MTDPSAPDAAPSPAAGETVLPSSAAGVRLDHAIHAALEAAGHAVSIREIKTALREGRILVNGHTRAPGALARGGERVTRTDFQPRLEAHVEPEPELLATLEVLFEDAGRVALAKPSGIPSNPLRAGERGTMLGAAIAVDASIRTAGPPLEGGLAHRLDVGTSGVLLFGRTGRDRETLRRAFRAGAVDKLYHALAYDPRNALQVGRVLDGAIASGSDASRVRVVDPNDPDALPARTEIVTSERLADGYRWVGLAARTGRRHQLRAHLASVSAPIAGDTIYGGPSPSGLARLGLHASVVVLPDGVRVEAPLDDALTRALAALRGR